MKDFFGPCALAVGLALSAASLSIAQPLNLAQNPGFEGTGGWGFGSLASIDSTVARSGQHCGKITGDQSMNNSPLSGFAQGVGGLRPNTGYTYMAWAKKMAGPLISANVYLYVKNHGNPELHAKVTSTNWQFLTIKFITGGAATGVEAGAWDDSNIGGTTYFDDFILVPSKAKIKVKGNRMSIVNGDSTPRAADSTDFGLVPVAGETRVAVYRIFNAGADSLKLTGAVRVTISGANAGDFSVAAQPAAAVAMLDSTAFTVRFDPSASGTRTALVSIANNDSTANPFTFAIKGTGNDGTAVRAYQISSREEPAGGASPHQKFNLFTIQGRWLYTFAVGEMRDMNLSGFPAGVYLVQPVGGKAAAACFVNMP